MAFVVDTSSAKSSTLAHWLVGGADGDGCSCGCSMRRTTSPNIAGDVLASGTTMQWNSPAKGWNAGAVMADAS